MAFSKPNSSTATSRISAVSKSHEHRRPKLSVMGLLPGLGEARRLGPAHNDCVGIDVHEALVLNEPTGKRRLPSARDVPQDHQARRIGLRLT